MTSPPAIAIAWNGWVLCPVGVVDIALDSRDWANENARIAERSNATSDATPFLMARMALGEVGVDESGLLGRTLRFEVRKTFTFA
jgi:hypothetical protein